jgi:hypothetical protein
VTLLLAGIVGSTAYGMAGPGSAEPGDELHLRSRKDNRPDSVVKMEIYKREIEPRHTVAWVLDDRDQVVRMWRSLGLTVLQVAEGNF